MTKLERPERLDSDKLEALKELFPQVFSDGKINFEALREELADEVEELTPGDEHYGLTWPGKREAKRLASKGPTGTLRPVPGEGVNEDTTKNLIIEGDNLEVLRIMQKAYAGRIKMIYIDPPYNTGNDFVYKDDFTEPLERYLQASGQADDNGMLVANPKASGRFHSAWLSMIYPRLRLARDLLRPDGVIFISIDHNELANLYSMGSEIFGEENLVSVIAVVSNWKGRSDDEYIATAHEYLLMFQKGKFQSYGIPMPDEYLEEYSYTDEDGQKYRLQGLRKRGSGAKREDRPNMYFSIFCDPVEGTVSLAQEGEGWVEVLPKLSSGEDGRWRWGKDTVTARTVELVGRKVSGTDRYDIFQKDYAFTGGVRKRIKPKSFWHGPQFSSEAGTLALKKIMPSKPFDTPKSPELIKYCLQQATRDNDIVLDFFAGSGTTGQAVQELNSEDNGHRQFILIQLPEALKHPNYQTIADVTKERNRLIANSLSDNGASQGLRTFSLGPSTIKRFADTGASGSASLISLYDGITSPFVDGWTKEGVVIEIMLLEGYPLDSEVTDASLFATNVVTEVQHPDQDTKLLICLDEAIEPETIIKAGEYTKTTFICLDSALTDEAKLQLDDKITLKTL